MFFFPKFDFVIHYFIRLHTFQVNCIITVCLSARVWTENKFPQKLISRKWKPWSVSCWQASWQWRNCVNTWQLTSLWCCFAITATKGCNKLISRSDNTSLHCVGWVNIPPNTFINIVPCFKALLVVYEERANKIFSTFVTITSQASLC